MGKTSESLENWNDFISFQDFLIKAALDEYKQFAVDHHAAQLSVIKNYLWLAAISASSIGAVLSAMSVHFSQMNSAQAIGMSFLAGAEVSSILVFISGIRLLLGEREGWRPVSIPSFKQLRDLAYGNNDSKLVLKTKSELLVHLDTSVQQLRKIITEKGGKIRELNKFLIASAASGLAGAVILFMAAHMEPL